MGGREAPPLDDSVFAYLRKRINSMREHEFAVLLYAFGMLNISYDTLPLDVRTKLEYRTTRVEGFLTARSISNALLGLAKCRTRWIDLSQESRESWMNAMMGPRGVTEMSALEVSQTLFALGLMETSWSTLPLPLRASLTVAADSRRSSMSPHGFSNAVWGLAVMGCEWRQLSLGVRQRLIGMVDLPKESASDANVLKSCSFALQALSSFGSGIPSEQVERLIFSSRRILEHPAADADIIADLVVALQSLDLLNHSSAMDLKDILMVKLRAVHSSVTPKKLLALNASLQKIRLENSKRDGPP